MLTQMARHWWVWVLRGFLAVVFGVTAYIWPEITIGVLVLSFGACVLVDGLFEAVGSIAHRDQYERRWLLLLDGLFGMGVGIATFVWPNITGTVLVYLIAAWAIVGGIFAIIAAFQLRREIANEWLVAVSGLLSVLFGVTIAVAPGAGAVARVWVIAAFAIFFGMLLIAFSYRVRSWGEEVGLLAYSISLQIPRRI